MHCPFRLKLLSVFVGVALLTEILASHANYFFTLQTNNPIYNVYLVIQFPVYYIYFRSVIASKSKKEVLFVFLLVYLFIWTITTYFVFGIYRWNSYAVIAGDVFTICICAVYFYESFVSEKLVHFKRTADFWVAVPIFIYSTCELPITGVLNHLTHNFEKLAVSLENVLQGLNIFMYLILIYAFLCTRKTNTMNS